MDIPRDGELVGEWYDRIRREAVEAEVAAAKREGVIEGLERALRKVEEVGHLEAAASVSGLIEAEIERLRRGE